MITFNKLIIIAGSSYSIRTDPINDLSELFSKLYNVNTSVILVVNHGTDIHMIDLGRLLIGNIEMLRLGNIDNLVLSLTPEQIYSYKSNIFENASTVKSFMSHDLPGDVMVSPYNHFNGETTSTSFDTNFRDMLITCTEYGLQRVIPCINGKLRYCNWDDNGTFLENRVELTRETSKITFLSFKDHDIELYKVGELLDGVVSLPKDTVHLLVLKGSLFYETPYMFSILPDGKFELNDLFVKYLFAKFDSSPFEDIISDVDSFIISIKAKQILFRNIVLVPESLDEEIPVFAYYEMGNQKHHTEYICIDNVSGSVKGITSVDEKYRHAIDLKKPTDHYLYVDDGSKDMRLVQLSVVS
jgi:hypothetical protein